MIRKRRHKDTPGVVIVLIIIIIILIKKCPAILSALTFYNFMAAIREIIVKLFSLEISDNRM